MKRKYGTRLMNFLTKDTLVVALFVLAIITGSLYALYIKDKDTAVFLVLNNYILSENKETLVSQKFITGLLGYAKQLLLIWTFGLFRFSVPLSMAVLYGMVFSYAFTTSCMVLIYGIKGLGVAVIVYGLQALIMITIGLYLAIMSIRRKDDLRRANTLSTYLFEALPIIAGSSVVVLLDTFVAVNAYNIVNKIL